MSASPFHAAGLPLLAGHASLDEPLAWARGPAAVAQAVPARRARLAPLLPEGGPVLPMTADRYLFALALGAAVARGQARLMPPNHTPDMVRRLHTCSPRRTCWATPASRHSTCPPLAYPELPPADGDAPAMPLVAADHAVAHVLTSGSTGQPMPHGKRWGAAGGQHPGRRPSGSPKPWAVPTCAASRSSAPSRPTTCTGFESTVLIALLGGAACATERPFFAQDIARVLASVPRPRVLVTTPLHLKTLLDDGIALPPVDLTISATAPAVAATGRPAPRRRSARPSWRSTAAPRPARWPRGAPPKRRSGAPSPDSSCRATANSRRVSGGHVPEPTAWPTSGRAGAHALSPARAQQRPGQTWPASAARSRT
jgi:hypothetical protein